MSGSSNNGFEVPNQGTGSGAYIYNPTGASWNFTGGAGAAANGSAFCVQSATNRNSDGTASAAGQVGFIQGQRHPRRQRHFPDPQRLRLRRSLRQLLHRAAG
jgi:hypothetical protein